MFEDSSDKIQVMHLDKILYGNSVIEYSLKFENRKTLGIRVYPDKTVKVLAPLDSLIDQVRDKVKKRASWILRQQDFFLSFHPLTPPRKFISGETHLYLGKQYRLKLSESVNQDVKLRGGVLEVFVRDKNDKKTVERLLKSWYREKADQHFEKIFLKNLILTKSFSKKPSGLKCRWMSKRWGSCDRNGVINLNLELIKAPKKCIEYVIVHELCHLKYHNHSRAFYELLGKVYPDWKETKNRLEKFMV